MVYYVVAFNDDKIFKSYIKNYLPSDRSVIVKNEDADSMFGKYNYGLNVLKNKLKDDDVVCFVHEDIKILDENFESKAQMVFNHRQDIGILGVYGTKEFTDGGGWWMTNRRLNCRGHIMQGRPDLAEPFHMTDGHIGFYDDLVSVDGCCFFMNGKIAQNYSFDTFTYDGYHFYDCDCCFSILEMGYKIAVADILVEHASEGPLPESWHKNRQKFLDKWMSKGKVFPVTKNNF